MCGISGIISKNGAPVIKERIARITDMVAHRGPDDSGFYFGEKLALGHRRLAIIDLSARGRQPMCYRGRYWITYNGEIYNYLEIRRELEERKGVQFETNTDTEVILAAYAEWGKACLEKFNGMWAFAIYDSKDEVIFIARDRFGVKPLYYTDDGNEFVFGSEIKQLIEFQSTVRANQRMLVESLLTHIDGHTDDTFFLGVKSLPQAHFLVYRLDNNSYTLHQYYELCVNDNLRSLSLDDSINMFTDLLKDSINLRLRSDVTVGTCLSGGLDSSTTSAIASQLYRSETSLRFSGIHAKSTEQGSDESDFARLVARCADINLSIVEPSTEDFVGSIDEVVYTQEEPFGSPSMFMGWHVFHEAKAQDCKVMLNGQGGDEVLLGYERYYAAILKSVSKLRFLREIHRQSRNSGLKAIDLIRYYVYFTNSQVRIRRLKAKSRLKRHVKEAHEFSYISRSADSFRSVSDMQIFEIGTLQLPHLLRYEDRNSMRHSIETRLPFLDYRLVEASVSLPAEYKIREGWTKYVLRRAAENYLPGEVVWRKNKLGFQAPEETWLAAYAGGMKSEISRSHILEEIADKTRILDEFSELSLKDRWAYFNIAAWERIFNVSWA